MFGLCLRYAKSREDAEDILQNGFIKVYRDLHQYTPKAPLGAWIRKVMVNTALEHLRKNKKHSFNDELPIDLQIEYSEELFGKLHAKELLQFIHSLPEEYSTVFNLYAIEGYSHKEIAEALNLSVSNSKVRLNRARTMLQAMLEKHYQTS
jgi:RNA polymerase sigma-70 factor (ECF subfamily)